MTTSTQSLAADHPADTIDDALEADVQGTIEKALRLYESGEKELANRLFERLKQRVLEAGPSAMLIGGSPSGEDDSELRDVVNAIADVARSKSVADTGDT